MDEHELIIITLETNNAAFHEGDFAYQKEVARILRKIASSIEHGKFPDYELDYNGNRVCNIEYELSSDSISRAFSGSD